MKNSKSRLHLTRELPVSRHFRDQTGFTEALFPCDDKDHSPDYARIALTLKNLSQRLPELKSCSPGEFYALGIWTTAYRKMLSAAFIESHTDLNARLIDTGDLIPILEAVTQTYPPATHYASESVPELSRLSEKDRNILIENDLILNLCQINPAAEYLNRVFFLPLNDEQSSPNILSLLDQVKFRGQSLKQWLMKPLQAHPDSLMHQLEYMRAHWEPFLGSWLDELLQGIDILAEENRVRSPGPGPVSVPEYSESSDPEYSPDRDWMPTVVMIAKNALVWLDQLSREFGRDISRLDQIPDETLDQLQERGFTALWLIGIWERSQVSRTIKQWTGQPDAEASAYSLKRYRVADQIGGPAALENLRDRAGQRGIRLASDMVPNHTGLDSDWMMEHPDYFISAPKPPFHTYSYRSENLSPDPRVSLHLEDHYFDHSDAAVTFKAVYHERGETRYIYHGNDGTSMPWNDTAQLDYLNPEVREAVIQTIIQVARQTPIIRFDAAMTLARKHIRRLWYPRPGEGGAIPSRALASLSDKEFNRHLPVEFWREVVNRVSEEAPDTLLLAEAFWMMEGYFVRTLGMHRVYNSAFMNMLKMEDNTAYRQLIKNTLEFDPRILKRYVNFLNNPDEETAVAQFGDGDKYFAVTTLMVTLPGLPLFGHGQWEGFHEKYGMEFRRAQWRESPNEALMRRHERDITPLLKKRWLFAHVERFYLFDLFTEEGKVDENVLVYSNFVGEERTLVAVNNAYQSTAGWIHRSAAYRRDDGEALRQITLGEAWDLPSDDRQFLCLRELRSGLWFLRRVKDIRDRGIRLQLRGYESQVYMDIHLQKDDPDHLLESLAREINGAGITDIDQSLKDRKRTKVLRQWSRDFTACALDQIPPTFSAVVRPLVALSSTEKTLPEEEVSLRMVFAGIGQKAPFGDRESALQLALRDFRRWWEQQFALPWPVTAEEEAVLFGKQ